MLSSNMPAASTTGGLTLETKLGMITIMILVFTFGFLVYRKVDMHQQKLTQASIAPQVEDASVRQGLMPDSHLTVEDLPGPQDPGFASNGDPAAATNAFGSQFDLAEPAAAGSLPAINDRFAGGSEALEDDPFGTAESMPVPVVSPGDEFALREFAQVDPPDIEATGIPTQNADSQVDDRLLAAADFSSPKMQAELNRRSDFGQSNLLEPPAIADPFRTGSDDTDSDTAAMDADAPLILFPETSNATSDAVAPPTDLNSFDSSADRPDPHAGQDFAATAAGEDAMPVFPVADQSNSASAFADSQPPVRNEFATNAAIATESTSAGHAASGDPVFPDLNELPASEIEGSPFADTPQLADQSSALQGQGMPGQAVPRHAPQEVPFSLADLPTDVPAYGTDNDPPLQLAMLDPQPDPQGQQSSGFAVGAGNPPEPAAGFGAFDALPNNTSQNGSAVVMPEPEPEMLFPNLDQTVESSGSTDPFGGIASDTMQADQGRVQAAGNPLNGGGGLNLSCSLQQPNPFGTAPPSVDAATGRRQGDDWQVDGRSPTVDASSARNAPAMFPSSSYSGSSNTRRTTPRTADGRFSLAAFNYQNSVPAPVDDGNTYEVTTVQSGENYYTISKRVYGTIRYFSALAVFNQHRIPDPKKMRPGMKVLTPPSELLEERYPELFVDSRPKERPTSRFKIQNDGSAWYQVGENETLSEISERYLGRSARWIEIYRLNQSLLKDPNKLKPGITLAMPDDAVEVNISP